MLNGWQCQKDDENQEYWYPAIDDSFEDYDEDFEAFSIWFWKTI